MKYISFLFFGIIALSACKNNLTDSKTADKTVVINGKVENATIKVLTITPPFGAESFNVDIEENDAFTTSFKLAEAGYVQFNLGREFGDFYAKPGDTIGISLDAEAFDESLQFTGSSQAENNYLAKKVLFEQELSKSPKELFTQPYEVFVETLSESKSKMLAFIGENKAGLNPEFLIQQKKFAEWDFLLENSNYESFSAYFNDGNSLETPTEYANLLNNLDLNDNDLLQYGGFNPIMDKALQNRGSKIEPGLTAAQYFQEMIKRAGTLKNTNIKEVVTYTQIENLINFGGGLDGITTEIDDYKAYAQNENYLTKLDALVEKWSPLKKGMPAPTFVAKYIDDRDFASEDLKGKNIYVDVWATWCGPCKREIPFLKEVEHDYEDQNIEFVSVSIDEESSTSIWKDFVAAEELGGTQVHAKKAWQSDLVKAYMIEGIPRFLLIDAEGKIVSANAPRPSDADLRPMLDALLAEK
ncbi:MAG: TlpA family protein disulfide reductase [Saprospiraceae bacterium]|nr:TlpA family protein disulfide reductase [Saprospiraceae bacterium]